MCLYVSLSVCLYSLFAHLGERLDGFAQFFLDEAGKVQGNISYIPNNYFDLLDVMHVKHKQILFEGKKGA